MCDRRNTGRQRQTAETEHARIHLSQWAKSLIISAMPPNNSNIILNTCYIRCVCVQVNSLGYTLNTMLMLTRVVYGIFVLQLATSLTTLTMVFEFDAQ